MREILFRGKRNGYAEQRDRDWLEGSLMIGDNGECEICYGTPRVRITYSVIPETVGQFTGLTDKNGKKIFEGDILQWVSPDGESGKVYVNFTRGVFGLQSVECPSAAPDLFADFEPDVLPLEVIGNIYDNPELLEAQS